MVGLRGAETLLSGSELEAGGLYLCLGGEVFGLGVVEFLLRDEAWPCFRSLLEAIVFCMQSRVICGCTRKGAFGAGDIFLAALHDRLRAFNLRGHLRHFKLGDQLPGAHAVADVDIDFADVAGDFGVNLHLLEGQELARHLKPIGERGAADAGNGRDGQSD